MNSDIKAQEQKRMDAVVGKIKIAQKKHQKRDCKRKKKIHKLSRKTFQTICELRQNLIQEYLRLQ